jgi:hypothetical protein
LGVLLRRPSMIVEPPEVVAESSTGLLWRVLGPVSGSFASFWVAPAAFSVPPTKSIPCPPLEKIELSRMRLPVAATPAITTASWPLKAMVLPSPEAVALMKLPGALMNTPEPLLPKSAAPPTFVPIKLPKTSLPLASAPKISTPLPLPEMVLPANSFLDTLRSRCAPSEELRTCTACQKVPAPDQDTSRHGGL